VLLGFALAVPLLNGCSQLGIATADDLTATESRLENSNRATNSRIDTLEKSTSDMQVSLNEIAASIDTLNARFGRAKVWLETMNIDTIAQDAEKATNAALAAESNAMAFFTQYLEWIKQQHAALEEQIKTLETATKKGGSGNTKSPDKTGDNSSKKPDDSGGGG
jgi:prefoldin subunit 5